MNKLLINTPQNVKIEYQLASVASRAIAFAIDYAVMLLYIFFIYLAVFRPGFIDSLDDWAAYGLISMLALPIFFYPLISETLMNGQSVGKRLMKIKVVKIDGTRATFYQYFIRWVSNAVDIFFSMGGLGLSSIILTEKSQRIGDIAADTTVINIKENPMIAQTIFAEAEEGYNIQYPEVYKLTDQDINDIKDIFQTGKTRKNKEIILGLATKIEILIGRKTQDIPEYFIEQVIADHYYTFKDKN